MSEGYAGQTALVTGASQGIGAQFATEFGRRGANLVLLARNGVALNELAGSLRAQFGVEVHVEVLDLADPAAAASLHSRLTDLGISVDILVNNAGAVHRGAIADTDPDLLTDIVTINVQAVVALAARFLPGMLSRGRGTIVNVSSTSGFQPAPYLAVYAASKAFVSNFSAALHAETHGTGVRVIAVCPGATATPMRRVNDLPTLFPERTAEQVVRTTLRALRAGKVSAVDGRRNAIFARLMPKVIPESTMLSLARRVAAPSAD